MERRKRGDKVLVDREIFEYSITLLERWTRAVHTDMIEAETIEFLRTMKKYLRAV